MIHYNITMFIDYTISYQINAVKQQQYFSLGAFSISSDRFNDFICVFYISFNVYKRKIYQCQ